MDVHHDDRDDHHDDTDVQHDDRDDHHDNKGIRDAGSTADFRILFVIFEI